MGSEEEAKRLIVLTCPKCTGSNEHYASELAEEQTLENLDAFSDRLHRGHEFLKKAGKCDCQPREDKPAKSRKRKILKPHSKSRTQKTKP